MSDRVYRFHNRPTEIKSITDREPTTSRDRPSTLMELPQMRPQANHPNWPLRKGKIRNALIQHFICFQALHNHKFAISDGVGEGGEMCCFVSHEEIEMSEKIIERERKALMNI